MAEKKTYTNAREVFVAYGIEKPYDMRVKNNEGELEKSHEEIIDLIKQEASKHAI